MPQQPCTERLKNCIKKTRGWGVRHADGRNAKDTCETRAARPPRQAYFELKHKQRKQNDVTLHSPFCPGPDGIANIPHLLSACVQPENFVMEIRRIGITKRTQTTCYANETSCGR